mgnify:CR=1 FL=1
MQRVRGYIFFNGSSMDDIQRLQLDEVEFYPFTSLFRQDKQIDSAGVLIDGHVSDAYSSKDIVRLLAEQAGEEAGYDVSIGSEDTIIPVRKEDIHGSYLSMRIEPPYDMGTLRDLLSGYEASDILIRTVEPEDNPKACIDIIGPAGDQDSIKKKIKRHYSVGEICSFKIDEK